ncbi:MULTISPECIES: DNA polymerase [Pseudomonas syringae group genomosp. 2]|uniref:DNA polymerase n=2 Tax=Pseudomonas syringae group TaxID=136849 RepID=UPI0001CC0E44|nr:MULTISPECIES: DNA polymerase [Pseudomonas syringae group genomosp. 2]KPW06798.1 DNA polymerase I [Pseudomonas amygdali pv. aesculi]MCQ3009072.1 DNA polymerase [Pseudomonas savastanoi]
MIKAKKVLMFVRDYTDSGNDKFFFWGDSTLSSVTIQQLVLEEAEIVCHDYWLIAPRIFASARGLPKTVTDLEELIIMSSGVKGDREKREKIDISSALQDFADSEVIKSYIDIFQKKSPINEVILQTIGEALFNLSVKTELVAKDNNEWERYTTVERPVADYLISSAAAGIAIDTTRLRIHKENIEFDYYMALKQFSAKYDVPLELPSNDDIIRRLEPMGYDFLGVDVEYVLNFVPMNDNFAIDLLRLRKIAKSRSVLNAIPLSQKRIYPIVDCFGSITSRIYFKDPSLQNLAKHHRDILVPDEGRAFSYVDYEQYEAGIMAALSGDEKLLELYADGDLYKQVANDIFEGEGRRKEAKRLFLSYAYGMKNRHLIDAAFGYGADRRATKTFFKQFGKFEEWKISVHDSFGKDQRIGTVLGNYLKRDRTGPLTDKEKRSAVSQLVQGTASLIFKKSLMKLRDEAGAGLKVPMHDAVLFEHSLEFNPQVVADLFSSTMTEHFSGKIIGKASLSPFSSKLNS